MRERCLFVGGDSDGKAFTVDKGIPFWRVPKTKNLPDVYVGDANLIPEVVDLEIDDYERQAFHFGKDDTVTIYAIKDMSAKEAFLRLIRYYYPKQENNHD